MKVAIIEQNSLIRKRIRELTKETDWNVNFFISPSEFGHTHLDYYDVIVSDHDLPGTNGRDLIKSISRKTEAEMILLGNSFNDEDVYNHKIKGLINKNNIEEIIEHLKYINVKLRLKNMVEEENKNLNDIVPTNGFDLKIKNDIIIIELKEILSESSRRKIEGEIKETDLKKAILLLPSNKKVSSTYIEMVIFVYKILKDIKGRLVFVSRGDETLKEQIEMCNLSLLVPTADSIEDAIRTLS
jgi:hypothetical protein